MLYFQSRKYECDTAFPINVNDSWDNLTDTLVGIILRIINDAGWTISPLEHVQIWIIWGGSFQSEPEGWTEITEGMTGRDLELIFRFCRFRGWTDRLFFWIREEVEGDGGV
jgi:hypothetical protein